MRIKISEVWNYRGESKELTVIETPTFNPSQARMAVMDWIYANRPDLSLAGVEDHGYYAVAI